MLSILLDQGTIPPEPAAAAAGGSGLLPWLPAGVAWLMTIAIIAYMLWQFRAEKSRQRTIDRFASPLVGALFALLALMAGTISQFYPGEITSAIPLAWAEKSPVSAALGFWISVVLMAALGIAYYAGDRAAAGAGDGDPAERIPRPAHPHGEADRHPADAAAGRLHAGLPRAVRGDARQLRAGPAGGG